MCLSRVVRVLVIRMDESRVKTQSPTVVLVSFEGPLHGLFEQDMGELESRVESFYLWQTFLTSSA